MIKILILFAIVVLSGALGAAISAEKKREAVIFSQFYDFNEKLKLNLKYGREKVAKVAESYPYVKRSFEGKSPVKGEDGEFLTSYVDGIGSSDVSTQTDYLNERGEKLKILKQKSEENYKKHGSMYFKLCLMGGILVAVLLA